MKPTVQNDSRSDHASIVRCQTRWSVAPGASYHAHSRGTSRSCAQFQVTLLLIGIGTLFAFMTATSQCMPQEATANKVNVMLSVEQTIAICFLNPQYNWLAAANPAARDYIRRVALESKNDMAADCALHVLGFIGDENDANVCLDVIDRELSNVSGRTRRSENAFRALGRFAERGVGKSRGRLEEMAKLDYWKDKRFDARRSASGISMLFENHTVPDAIFALADAGISSAEQLAKRAIRESQSGKPREWAEWRMGAEKLKAHHDAIRRELNNAITDDDVSVLDATYHSIDSLEIERLELPKPDATKKPMPKSDPRLRPRLLSLEEKRALAGEANDAYVELTKLVKNEDYNKLIPRLLVASLFVTRESFAPVDREEIVAKLAEMRLVLREIDGLKPAASDPVISVGYDAFNSDHAEVITGTWMLPGTERIGRRLWNDGRGRHTVVQGKGTLVVLMKKKNGVWYWNPFGW